MKKFFLQVFPILLALPCWAQQPQLLQERNYLPSPKEKQILCSAPGRQGEIYLSGTMLKAPLVFESYFLKVKPNTDTLWTRKGEDNLPAAEHALHPTHDGGFIFSAAKVSSPFSPIVGTLFDRRNTKGQTIWNKINYPSSGISYPTSMLIMPNKGLMLGGAAVIGNLNNGFSLIRTDSSGHIQWQKGYGRSSLDLLQDMQFTPNGQIIAAGYAENPIGPAHLRLMLFNQQGDSLKGSQPVFTGFNRFESMLSNFNSITPLSDGGFLVTGSTDTTSSASPHTYVMGMVAKVDSNLLPQWHYVHRTPTNPVEEYNFSKAKELADGSLLVLGFKVRPFANNSFQFYHFSSNGQLLNVYPFNSNICSQTWGVTLDFLPDSTYMVGGRCANGNPTTFGYYVAKVKVPGLPLPLPPINITSTKAELVASGTGLGQSYPNPTASTAIIPYTLPQHYSKANILIREIATGREIRRYELKRGNSSLNVDLGNLSNGLYLYSLVVDEKPVATKKLAVMK